MPLYEYLCDACGHQFEVIQKFSDPLVEVCPKCGGAVKKLLSSPAIQFKGTGWYITDYARKGDAGGKAGSKESKQTSEASQDAKSDKAAKSDHAASASSSAGSSSSDGGSKSSSDAGSSSLKDSGSSSAPPSTTPAKSDKA